MQRLCPRPIAHAKASAAATVIWLHGAPIEADTVAQRWMFGTVAAVSLAFWASMGRLAGLF